MWQHNKNEFVREKTKFQNMLFYQDLLTVNMNLWLLAFPILLVLQKCKRLEMENMCSEVLNMMTHFVQPTC